jgi:hypothetical protein
VIRRGHLYFATPASFNDPFDCRIYPRFNYPQKSLNRHFAWVLREQPMNRAERRRKTKEARPSNRLFEEAFEMTMQGFRQEYGVLCLSAIENDILMWSHYAEAHSGVCFKFSTAPELFQAAQPVEYPTRYPELDYIGLLEDMNNKESEPVADEAKKELASKLFLTKALHWKYECEWRILRFDLDRAHPGPGVVDFPANSLVGVILGCRADPSRRDYVRRLLRETGSGARLYQAKESRTEFALDITPL